MTSNFQPTCSDAYLDKMRVVEALLARDYAVHQMENTFASLQTKEAAIMQLLTEKAHLESQLETLSLDDGNKTGAGESGLESPSSDLEAVAKENTELKAALEASRASSAPANSSPLKLPTPRSPQTPGVARPGHSHEQEESESPEAIIKARYAILAGLPVPSDMPTDILVPIVIPPPFTLQDFIGTISGPLRLQLASYRVFQETTTCWCPDREEHGYYITPVYRCNTNPRVSTAHRWITVDLDAELDKPTECFFKKEGKWYYAGVYKTFRLRDIAPQEWTRLAPETTQALIKDTITHRKNTSPQNIYETGQLYAVGALKAACIGLQCIGFNEALYKGLLAQAAACAKTGRWRGAVVGLGTGATWNSNANAGAENVKTREEVNNTEVGAAPEKT